MSYRRISRDETVWSGDYIGCGLGIEEPAPSLAPQVSVAVQPSAIPIPVPPGGGGSTAVLPTGTQTVSAPVGWVTQSTYKNWKIQINRGYCPPGVLCKMTVPHYRAVRAERVSPSFITAAQAHQWVDHQEDAPEASGPVTVRTDPQAPTPSIYHQQLVVGGPPPPQGYVVVPPGQQPPKVVTPVAVSTDTPPPPPSTPETKRGKGLLTAAGVAAAAYLLLGG